MDFQSRIQKVIYSLGEGWGRTLLRMFIAAALLLLVFFTYARQQFSGLRDPDAMELGQLAQNLAQGRGFVTDCLRPADLGFLERAGDAPAAGSGIPDIRHAPAYPGLLAAVLRVIRPSMAAPPAGRLFAPEATAVLPLGFLCTLLCGLLVMRAGSRLFDARVGVAAFVVFALSEGVLRATISGGVAPLGMLLTTAALGLALEAGALRERQAHPAAWVATALLAGLVAGLAVLTSYALIVVPVVAVLLLAWGFVRWRGVVVTVFLVAALAVVAPWVVRNQQVSGHILGIAPYTALNHSPLYAEDGWDRTQTPHSDSRDVLRAMTLKFVGNVADLYGNRLRLLGDGLVMCFFLVALFWRFEEERADRLKWSLALGLVLTIAIAAFGQPGADTLLPLLPMLAIVGVAFLYKLLDQMLFLTPELKLAIAMGWVALAALPLLLTLTGPAARRPYPPYSPQLIQYVCGLLKPGEILATDIPWAVAWYGDKPGLQLPRTTDALAGMHAQGVPIGGVYVTTVTGDAPYISTLVQGRERSWLPLLNQLVPEDFPWQHGIALPPGTRDQIFLTDAERWVE